MVPALVLAVAAIFLFSPKDRFSDFLLGTKDGIQSCFSIFPSLLALTSALSLLNASGLSDALAKALAPVGAALGIPSELFPLLIVRPLSGSGALATFSDILSRYGADSFTGLCASVIMASSDTLIYIAAVYFSAAKVKKTGYTLPLGLLVSAFTVFLSCALCRIFFA